MKTFLICTALLTGLTLTNPAHALESDEVVWGCKDAGYVQPTDEYRHGVLGDDIEYKGLMLLVHTDAGVLPAVLELPEGQVYEDIAPRCGDLDGDGEDDVVAVISDAVNGARLAIYSKRAGPLAETPPIGRGYRWLAPIGIADMNGDGQNDVAYVETPHLGGTLRVWTLRDGELVEIANARGYSNHRIGEDFITGGVRDCGDGPELVLPDFGWDELRAVKLKDGVLVSETLGNDTGRETVKAALACQGD